MAPTLMRTGTGIIAQRMFGTTPGQHEPNYLQWGTSATVEAATQTALVAPANEARVAGTGSSITITNANDTHQVQGSIVSASAQTIQEVGLFDAAGSGTPATGGNMYIRAVHGASTLAINDSIQYTIQIQFTTS